MVTTEASLRRHQALAVPTRADIWRQLRAAGRPLSVQEVAELSGLHPNTARVHLDTLVEADLAERLRDKSDTPGRPRALYIWHDSADVDEASYEELARALAAQVAASSDPAGLARAAGERWARAIDANSERPVEADAAQAEAEIVRVMSQLGFDPEQAGAEIHLRRCPFADTARENRTVVCGVHVGMLQALADDMGGAVKVKRLQPFVQEDPLLCVLHLAPVRGAAKSQPKSTSTTSKRSSK